MVGVGKKVIEIWPILEMALNNKVDENWPYLDNFVTNPMHILAYSGDSDPKSPEYAKKV